LGDLFNLFQLRLVIARKTTIIVQVGGRSKFLGFLDLNCRESASAIFQVEEEIRGFMHKSLKYVEMLDTPVAKRHEIYSYRAAVVHQKLASMYFRKYKDQVRDP